MKSVSFRFLMVSSVTLLAAGFAVHFLSDSGHKGASGGGAVALNSNSLFCGAVGEYAKEAFAEWRAGTHKSDAIEAVSYGLMMELPSHSIGAAGGKAFVSAVNSAYQSVYSGSFESAGDAARSISRECEIKMAEAEVMVVRAKEVCTVALDLMIQTLQIKRLGIPLDQALNVATKPEIKSVVRSIYSSRSEISYIAEVASTCTHDALGITGI